MSRPVKQQHYDPTEERGILIVKQRIADWAWIYRDQRQSDVGIDGHIEPVDDGEPTGRLVAVQVRSGPSRFRSGKKSSIRHAVTRRHRDYWLGHSLPVIVVLVDLESKEAYWQVANTDTIRKAKRGYAIDVPRSQVLDAAGAAQLRALARPRAEMQLLKLRDELRAFPALQREVEFDFTFASDGACSISAQLRPQSLLRELGRLVIPSTADPVEATRIREFFASGEKELTASTRDLILQSELLEPFLSRLPLAEPGAVTVTNAMVGRTALVRLVVADLDAHPELERFRERARFLRAEPVTLTVAAWGTREKRIQVQLDDGPFSFTISMGGSSVTSDFDYIDRPIREVVAAERLVAALTRGCRVALLTPEREELVTFELDPQAQPRPDLLSGFEALADLAEHLAVDFRLDRDVSLREMASWISLRELLRNGRRSLSNLHAWVPVSDEQQARELLNIIQSDMPPISAELTHAEDQEDVLGRIVPVPTTQIQVSRLSFDPEDVRRLSCVPFEPFRIRIQSAHDAEIWQTVAA